MSSYNSVGLMGNLVKDPELKNAANGTPVCQFTIAVNNGYGENASTAYVDCVTFGKQAELIAKHFTKGRPIIVSGKIQQRNWEKDGQKRSKLEVILNSYEGFNFVPGSGPREVGEQEPATTKTEEKLF